MTTKERLRVVVMEELINGKINATVAAVKLNLKIRQIKRLKQRYKADGYDGLIHKARGKTGTRKTDINLENKIVQIIKQNYHDFGPLLAYEKLQEYHDISLSDETIRQIMIRNKIWKNKRRKRNQYHCWRQRREAYGHLQQFDGSYHNWFEGRNPDIPEACLLASIDDATGRITHAVFDKNEGVMAVFNFWRQYVIKHGIPSEIYLDKFSTYKINHQCAVDNTMLMTQFGRTTKELGIKLIMANSPQAKGRIERLFQTLQDRLIKEMRLMKINTIDEANKFLTDQFVPWFNNRFAVIPRSDNDCHRKLDMSTRMKLNSIFSKQYYRCINNDFTIQYLSSFYQLKEIQPVTIFKTDKVIIEERLDNTIKIKCRRRYLNYIKLQDRPLKVKSSPTVLTNHKSNWIPPKDHPWRRFVY